MSGWRLSAPASWAEHLAASFRATGQGIRRCLGRAFRDLTLRRVSIHRTHCLRSRLTFVMIILFSFLMYAELCSRFLYKFSVFRCLKKPVGSPCQMRVLMLRTKSPSKCYESLERLISISHKHWTHGKINGGQKRTIPLDIRNGVIHTKNGVSYRTPP